MGLRRVLKENGPMIDTALLKALDRRFNRLNPPAGPLFEAMRYALESGGKRLRPVLLMQSCELCGGDPTKALYAGVALEFIHTYSLIHDDLPAMDDAEMRRGKAATHKVFGEGMAVLAGDALLTEAFAILADGPEEGGVDDSVKISVVQAIADGSGVRGMVRGQELDLFFEGGKADARQLAEIHLHKTAAMFKAALVAGALIAGAPTETVERLGHFGETIGLAFQVRDDLLDIDGDAEEVGKDLGADQRNEKSTYPSLLGVEASRELMSRMITESIELLAPFGDRASLLIELAKLIGERRS